MVEDTSIAASGSTSAELWAMARDTGQRLLNHYVRVQGLTISQVRQILNKLVISDRYIVQ